MMSWISTAIVFSASADVFSPISAWLSRSSSTETICGPSGTVYIMRAFGVLCAIAGAGAVKALGSKIKTVNDNTSNAMAADQLDNAADNMSAAADNVRDNADAAADNMQ